MTINDVHTPTTILSALIFRFSFSLCVVGQHKFGEGQCKRIKFSKSCVAAYVSRLDTANWLIHLMLSILLIGAPEYSGFSAAGK